MNHARSKHVVHVYYHITRILGVGEQCKMESTSCDSKLLHARRKVPLVKPSAHLAFRTTRHTDVPPSLGCTPSLSSSGSSKWISRNASACKNALATSNDIQQHPSWSELTPLERTSQAVRNGGDPARKSSRLSCASFISTNQHSTQASPFSSCPLLCCTQLLVMSGQPCDEATSRGALSYTALDLSCSSPSARPRATPLCPLPSSRPSGHILNGNSFHRLSPGGPQRVRQPLGLGSQQL